MKRRFIAGIIMIAFVFAMSFMAGGCQKAQDPKAEANHNTVTVNPEISQDITLYFSDSQAMYLIPEKRSIKIAKDADQAALVEEAVKQLIAGPKNTDLIATFPPETRVLDVKIEDSIAVINFSEELRSKHWGGSTGEMMTLGSLANTLTELEGIKGVQILLNGEKVESLLGHMDARSPLQRDESLIKTQ